MKRPDKLEGLIGKLRSLGAGAKDVADEEITSFVKGLHHKDNIQLLAYLSERNLHKELLRGLGYVCASCPWMESMQTDSEITFSCEQGKGLRLTFNLRSGKWVEETKAECGEFQIP